MWPDAVDDRQHDDLEQRPHGHALLLRHALSQESELLSDPEIDVAAFARLQQFRIAALDGGDPDLLLGIIAIRQYTPWRRRDQEPQPFGWAEYQFRGARRAAR